MSHPANDIYFENQRDHQEERIDILMDLFLKQAEYAKALTCAGHNFIRVHEAQIFASETIHTIKEENLLGMAKDMYPEEKELMEDYLDIYNEVKK